LPKSQPGGIFAFVFFAGTPAMPEIQKVRWNHEAVIDAMLANPDMSQNELAAVFGYSPAWLSIVINSDAFQAKLSERREELINPILRSTLEDRMRGVAAKAAEVILEKLHAAPELKGAISALEVTTRALGYGAKTSEVNVTVQPVAVVPAKELSTEAWSRNYSPNGRPAEVIDVTPSAS
jgi:hypothetical protein